MKPDRLSGDSTLLVGAESATTTVVRADYVFCAEDSPELHHQLRAQLKELRLRNPLAAAPDLGHVAAARQRPLRSHR